MDREILFRGKRESDGKWLYGLYSDHFVHGTDFPCIMPLRMEKDDGDWAVLRDTVGQYTGKNDKNGTKIFEGDIVILRFNPCVVKWDTDNACYAFYQNGITKMSGFNADTMKLLEVIGNIHDDSDLLEVSE